MMYVCKEVCHSKELFGILVYGSLVEELKKFPRNKSIPMMINYPLLQMFCFTLAQSQLNPT